MGKLDSTDNKLENYFGNTLNKYIKKIFRTKTMFIQLHIPEKKWLERKQQISTKKLTVLLFPKHNLYIFSFTNL